MKRNSSARVESIIKQVSSLQIGEIAELERELSRPRNRMIRMVLQETATNASMPCFDPDDEPSEPTLPFGDDAPLAPSIDEGP